MKFGIIVTSVVAALFLSANTWATDVEVKDPWIAEAPPGAFAVGAFMTLSNSAGIERKLVSISSPAAERVEMHTTIIKDGVASMVEQSELLIPAGGEFVLKPGGYHIMLIRPQAMKAGDEVEMMLKFANGEVQGVTAQVRKRMSGGGHAHHHHH